MSGKERQAAKGIVDMTLVQVSHATDSGAKWSGAPLSNRRHLAALRDLAPKALARSSARAASASSHDPFTIWR